MESRRREFPAHQRIAALLCTAAYLAGGIEVFPQALALGAWLEGAHTLRIARNGKQVTIVLSHERGLPGRPDYTPRHQPDSPRHRHGAAAHMLCVFATQRSRQADHVACFAIGSICESLRQVIEAKPSSLELAVAGSPAIVSCATGCSPILSFPNPDSSPPRPPDSLRLLRSAVLVI